MRLIVLVGLVACASPLGTTESAIRGGTTDDGDPAVVALSILGMYQYCSATLVAPHTLLTAGHCNNSIGIVADFGTDSAMPVQTIDVTDVVLHPMYTAEGAPYDFALMKLASDPGILPIRLSDTALDSSNVGQMIRHVGYGVTDDTTSDGGGTKRSVTYPLNTIDDVLIYSGAPDEQTCSGDSGAPGFMTFGGFEVLTGVVSDGPNCDLSQDGWDDRVDVVKDWIITTVSAWDDPPTFGSDSVVTSSSGGCDVGGGAGALVALAFLGMRRRK